MNSCRLMSAHEHDMICLVLAADLLLTVTAEC